MTKTQIIALLESKKDYYNQEVEKAYQNFGIDSEIHQFWLSHWGAINEVLEEIKGGKK